MLAINLYEGHTETILLVVKPAMQAAYVASSQALRLAKDIDSDGLYSNLKNNLSVSVTISLQ